MQVQSYLLINMLPISDVIGSKVFALPDMDSSTAKLQNGRMRIFFLVLVVKLYEALNSSYRQSFAIFDLR